MMRKAVANGNLPGKEGSGRRYWMRANPMAPKAVPNEGLGKRPSKARFLEPYRLSDERRAALIQLLDDGGIGDGESRELFASAIEYDIANARQALAREPPPAAAEPPIAEPVTAEAPAVLPEAAETAPALPADLAYTARSLAERIAGLEGSVRNAIVEALQGRDSFQRVYTGAYLEALCAELNRLADAVASQPQHPTPETAQPPAPSSSCPGAAPGRECPALPASGGAGIRRGPGIPGRSRAGWCLRGCPRPGGGGGRDRAAPGAGHARAGVARGLIPAPGGIPPPVGRCGRPRYRPLG